MVPSSGRLPPPHGMVQVGVQGPGTWHAFTAPSLGYVAFHVCLVPALSRVPCKYHRILHHLQRLRLHQPAFHPSTTTPPTPTGGGAGNHDHPRGGGVGVPRAVPYIRLAVLYLHYTRCGLDCGLEVAALPHHAAGRAWRRRTCPSVAIT